MLTHGLGVREGGAVLRSPPRPALCQKRRIWSDKGAWSGAAILFCEAAPGLALGMEDRHAERELFNSQSGPIDRLRFIAKQSF